jgi:tetratricopeptide (TPR) repeat protein
MLRMVVVLGLTGCLGQGLCQVSARALYESASDDFASGKSALAAVEYTDFVRSYPDDPHAPAAQYRIGQIHISHLEYDLAVMEFDALLNRYPESKVAPDALFMKGVALKNLKRLDAAADAFRMVIINYPRSYLVSSCKTLLQEMATSRPPKRQSIEHGAGPVVGLNDRPNVVGNWHLSKPSVQQWFNTTAFAANAPYTFGNAGAWILRAPGRVNLDLAASKTFAVSERVSVQLRFESFNAANTPPLGAPNTQVGNPLFGHVTSAGTARDNRIGVRLLY